MGGAEDQPESDRFDLARFVAAQAATYDAALAEIRRGAKRSHWMWFVFPQLAGLGASATAARYAISSPAEARAYLAHPLLGHRYRACIDALGELTGTTAEQVFGPVDAMKLRSSLTLFSAVATDAPAIAAALRRWFGAPDPRTIALLATG